MFFFIYIYHTIMHSLSYACIYPHTHTHTQIYTFGPICRFSIICFCLYISMPAFFPDESRWPLTFWSLDLLEVSFHTGVIPGHCCVDWLNAEWLCVCFLQTVLRGHRAGGLAGAAERLCADALSCCWHVAGAAGGRGAQPWWVSLTLCEPPKSLCKGNKHSQRRNLF